MKLRSSLLAFLVLSVASSACVGPEEKVDSDASELASVRGDWTTLWDSQIASGVSPTCAYDVARKEVVFFGGGTGTEPALAPVATWSWDGSTLKAIAAAGASPPPRVGGAMTYDSARNKIVFFGGRGANNAAPTDVWELDSGGWKQVVVPLGAAKPRGRMDAALAFDANRQRVVLFGGREVLQHRELDDTWEWDGVAWTELQPTTAPPGRSSAAATWVPGYGVIVQGGVAPYVNPTYPSDGYAFDGTTWSPLETSSMSKPHGSSSAAFDPGWGLVVGGNEGAPTMTATFLLSPDGTWKKLTSGLGAPHCLSYFPKTNRVLAFTSRGTVSELAISSVPNTKPKFVGLTNRAVFVEDPVQLDLAAVDGDVLDPLTFGLANAPPGAWIEGGTRFRWTPTAKGIYPVSFTVSDGAATTTKTIAITVKSHAYAIFAQGAVAFEAVFGAGSIHRRCHRQEDREWEDDCIDEPGSVTLSCSVRGKNPGKVELRCQPSHWPSHDVGAVLEPDGSFAIAGSLAMRGRVRLTPSGDHVLRIDSFRYAAGEYEHVRGSTPEIPLAPAN